MKNALATWSLPRVLAPALAAALLSGLSLAQEHRAISLAGPGASLPFSDGVVAGNMLFVAGQEGLDGGKLAPGGIGPETRAALAAIERVVKAAGFQMNDIVSVTVYLADIKDFDDMNKVYRTVVPDPKLARATVQAAALVGNAHVEIAVIAVKQ